MNIKATIRRWLMGEENPTNNIYGVLRARELQVVDAHGNPRITLGIPEPDNGGSAIVVEDANYQTTIYIKVNPDESGIIFLKEGKVCRAMMFDGMGNFQINQPTEADENAMQTFFKILNLPSKEQREHINSLSPEEANWLLENVKLSDMGWGMFTTEERCQPIEALFGKLWIKGNNIRLTFKEPPPEQSGE